MNTLTLKVARTRRRMGQVALAEKSGLNQSTVSRLEKGGIKRPTPETVEKLERALQLKPGQLAFGEQVSA